jgi:hypothetical protein
VHLSNIAELTELRVNGKTGPMGQLEVSCKNFELVKFSFHGEAVSGDVYIKINQLLMSNHQPAAYVFARQPDTSGWAAYDPQAEFTRLGFKAPKSGAQFGGFRITHVNSNYKMSPTYPSAFVVPASVSDGELRKISFFRARGRVPAVTYRHRNGAVVARCAQPLVGLRRKRCTSDEAYMTALRRECKGKLLFIDCRSQTSAYGNIALGGGFEVYVLCNRCSMSRLSLVIKNIVSPAWTTTRTPTSCSWGLRISIQCEILYANSSTWRRTRCAATSDPTGCRVLRCVGLAQLVTCFEATFAYFVLLDDRARGGLSTCAPSWCRVQCASRSLSKVPV